MLERIWCQRAIHRYAREWSLTVPHIDNNDGRQETLTGAGTTHDSNKTLFQLPTKQELDTVKQLAHPV